MQTFLSDIRSGKLEAKRDGLLLVLPLFAWLVRWGGERGHRRGFGVLSLLNKYSTFLFGSSFTQHLKKKKKVCVGQRRTPDSGVMVDDDKCDLNGALFIMSNKCAPYPDLQSDSEWVYRNRSSLMSVGNRLVIIYSFSYTFGLCWKGHVSALAWVWQ